MKKALLAGALCLTLAQSHLAFAAQAPARALFVSVLQEPQVLSSRKSIQQLVLFAKKSHTQVLFVQVYRANKAWFPSKVSDSAPYQSCLQSVGEDPVAFLIKEAHASGIEVHAWLNLLSLSANDKAPLLKHYGPQILTQNLKPKKELSDYKIDNQYFLEPGDLRVREILTTVVGELVRTYRDLDGIQFDYIRYPDKDPHYGYTAMNMERFKQATGQSSIEEESDVWKNWKREQVTELLKLLVKEARTIHPEIQVSTTGLMPFSRAYHEGYQDWRFWLRNQTVQFVTLMSYTKDARQFYRYLQDAKKHAPDLSRVNVAVGAYDKLKNAGIFKEQWKACEASGTKACVALHYGNLLENPALAKPLLRKRAAA